jgi:nucleotide-binding universal stress UspA family protein
MFEKILLPADFSSDSRRVLDYVGEIPGIREAILFHVVDATRPSRHGWEHGPHIENARILIGENRQALEKTGAPAGLVINTAVSTITQGSIAQAILDKAGAEGVSLIMMGARGKNRIRELLLGSVSAAVLRNARIPVLLMRFLPECCATGERRGLFSRVLVPVDLSGPSMAGIAVARDIRATGEVILLHVVDRGESEDEIRVAVSTARERLETARQDLLASEIRAEILVHVGNPPEEILATALREDVTLILMSPRGAGWTRELRSLVLGSTTDAVIRQTHCPVLVSAGHTEK